MPRRQLLPHCQPHGSHSLHPRYVLRRPRPRCSDGQLRVRLLQQRRRCDVSLHEVRGRNVPGHGGAGLLQAMPCWIDVFCRCYVVQLRISSGAVTCLQCLSSRLLLNLGRVIAVLHAVPRRTDAAAVRPAQLHSVRRRQLLFNCRPGRSNRQLRSRILLLQWRRFCILHSLSRRQILPLPCYVRRDAVPCRQLLPHCKPHGSHSLHPRYVLRRPRPVSYTHLRAHET